MRWDNDTTASLMGDAPIDIGEGVRIYQDKDGRPAGLFEEHKDKDGHTCGGAVTFVIPGVVERDGSQPMWDVLQVEPLTLSPSILCTSCGRHGYIRNGRWENA